MKGVDTMAFYRICPDCGAYLDPGEQCSCHEECLIEMERKEKARINGGRNVRPLWLRKKIETDTLIAPSW